MAKKKTTTQKAQPESGLFDVVEQMERDINRWLSRFYFGNGDDYAPGDAQAEAQNKAGKARKKVYNSVMKKLDHKEQVFLRDLLYCVHQAGEKGVERRIRENLDRALFR